MLKKITESPRTQVRGSRVSFFDDFPNITPSPGTVLVRTRAISARVNKNYDGFSSSELKKAYQTFIGRPVFVNHQNMNHRETRGVVRGSVYKEMGKDKYIDLLIEIDAKAYPKLAAEIETSRLDGVSMGCFLPGTLITLEDGNEQEIENIVVGDEVVTHTGKIEPVTFVMSRPYAGEVYSIEFEDQTTDLVLTPNHPVWVQRDECSGWKNAKDIKIDDCVYSPLDRGWYPVTKAYAHEYLGSVYNFEVQDDNSYVAAGVAVHNCDVTHTVCSYCGNVAKDPYMFCSHVLYNKGQTLEKISETFEKQSVLVYEQCEGVNFFEISFVFDPADETALVQEVYVPGGYHASIRTPDISFDVIPKVSYDDTVAPPKVDTLRNQESCPSCEDENFDGEKCELCDYVKPPDELDDPDIEHAKQVDLRQNNPLDRQARRSLNPNPFVRRS